MGWLRPERPKRRPEPPAPALNLQRLATPSASARARVPAQPAPAPSAPEVTVGRFSSGAEALTLIAALPEQARRGLPPVRRGTDGAIFVELSAARPADAALAQAFGGVVYRTAGSDLVSSRDHRLHRDHLRALPEVTMVELAAALGPHADPSDQPEVLVITTGLLASWIIERFTTADLDLHVASALLRPLFHHSADVWPAILLRVAGRDHPVRRTSLSALAGLPQTVVCRPGDRRLLVDQRIRLPLPDPELARSVPAGEEWLLSGELGAWQVTARGPETPPPVVVRPELTPPPVAPPGRVPDPRVEVTMVPETRSQTTDALLLTDDELTPLRHYLTGHPAAGRGFLIPGPGLHVYAEPARTVGEIPFGIPLRRIGPGPLYQQVGYRLKPELPAPARAALFRVDDDSLVVLGPHRAHRLALTAVPIWALWLGAEPVGAPAHPEPLSAAAQEILRRVDAADARVDAAAAGPDEPTAAHDDRRAEAFRLEQRGRLQEAARTYWEAGDTATAARLYEQAAASADDRE